MTPLPDLELLVPFPEVARRLGVAINTLHNWRRRRPVALAAWKLGGSWRTTEAAVEAFARGCTEIPEPGEATPTRRPTPKQLSRQVAADVEWCRNFRVHRR